MPRTSLPSARRGWSRSDAGSWVTRAARRGTGRESSRPLLGCLGTAQEHFPGAALGGALIGALLPVLTWLGDLGPFGTWGVNDLIRAHNENRLYWVIDAAPLVLGAFAARTWHWRRRLLRSQYEHDFLNSILGSIESVMLLFDPSGRILHANAATEHTLGYTPAELQRQSLWDLMTVPGGSAEVHDVCSGADRERFPYRLEAIVRTRDGSRSRLSWSITVVPDASNRMPLFLATGVDVTERHRLQERLTHQAFHDPLTGLANRALLMERVNRAMSTSPDEVVLLFIDLDDFKAINDSYGHLVGDRLLRAVAQRLLQITRGTDTPARLGGDEFAVLLERAESADDALAITQRISAALSQPIRVLDHDISIGTSIGVAAGDGDLTVDTLLRHADTAMYLAKRSGKDRYLVYDTVLHGSEMARLQLEKELRLAIDDQQMVLHYQPIVRLGTGRVQAVEALVRWMHPERGMIAPINFIPIAEDTGAIVPLGRWVLREGCRQVRQWHERSDRTGPLHLMVNISGRQLERPDFLDDLRTILREERFDPRNLVLEITESVLMNDPEAVQQNLERIRELGVRIAIDDFGTGYSSLSYLQRFPVDLLKLDREFVYDIGKRDSDTRLTHAILSLGQTLDLVTIAEGVEEVEQVEVLQELRCDLAQGFYFARPLSAAQVEELLDRSPAAPRGAEVGAFPQRLNPQRT